MGTTRFCRPQDNAAQRAPGSTLTYPRIINGNTGAYPSAPSRLEDAQYPMDYLLLRDRYTPWSKGAGAAAPFNLQVDLGQNVAVSLIGLHGLRYGTGITNPSSVVVGWRSAAQGYSPTSYTTAATIAISSASRDAQAVPGLGAVARYWQFAFNTLAALQAFSLGGIYLGPIPYDLGVISAPGLLDMNAYPVSRSRTGAGHPHVTDVGDPRRLVSMPFVNINDALRAKVDAVFGPGTSRDPAYWLDQNDVLRQVVLSGDQLGWTLNFTPPNAWSATVEVEVLG